ncbi:hypothetical protein BDQ94DRAFT_39486 [Aspergillus welwitschiae]|uniref:Uncharacterized protein n=1 Tax=Aspergillus welwitschiae TaxID=1341132 RepID=A0A3F3Q107_9EURO|nr:hypothetical protein BDQ94DRAFT_39486 [Aspergillus welwitschiae]RDH32672.1 hypothetical protein BDQ94DRAFT_39486 [Aspergillus welwitschiae]
MGGGRPVDDAQIAGAKRLSNSSRAAITKSDCRRSCRGFYVFSRLIISLLCCVEKTSLDRVLVIRCLGSNIPDSSLLSRSQPITQAPGLSYSSGAARLQDRAYFSEIHRNYDW